MNQAMMAERSPEKPLPSAARSNGEIASHGEAPAGRGPRLSLVPVTQRVAKAFIRALHRHLPKPPPGAKFCIGVEADGQLVGVAMVGRPVSRMLDDGRTFEVNRTCTNGYRNANSMLYGAAWRAAKAMGYRRGFTYLLPGEDGASLKAAGWRYDGRAGGGAWDRLARPRLDLGPLDEKQRWVIP